MFAISIGYTWQWVCTGIAKDCVIHFSLRLCTGELGLQCACVLTWMKCVLSEHVCMGMYVCVRNGVVFLIQECKALTFGITCTLLEHPKVQH